MWDSIKQLHAQVRSWLRFHRLSQALERVCPAAETIAEEDSTCVVCRQAMIPGAAGDDCPRVLPACKHVFHTGCLRLWLQRQQNCPTCRKEVELKSPEASTLAAPPPTNSGVTAGGVPTVVAPTGQHAHALQAHLLEQLAGLQAQYRDCALHIEQRRCQAGSAELNAVRGDSLITHWKSSRLDWS